MHHEAKDRDPVWDCTLIKVMREHGDTVVNPIYEWDDADVWKYIRDNNIDINPLYENGYSRVGCIGCPMASWRHVNKEFADYPKYKDAYIRAFQRMIDASRKKAEDKGETYRGNWKTGEEVFYWWIEEYKHIAKGQMRIENYEEGDG